jgi:hypothetical protein
MKNFNIISRWRVIVTQIFFTFIVSGAAFLFLPGVSSAQDFVFLTASSSVPQTTASTTAEQEAAIRAAVDAKAAADVVEQKRLADEQILQQIEAFRGIVSNSSLNALQKKYQVGAYAPKPPAPVALVASSTPKTNTTGDISFVFLKNLKQGDTSADVMMLQVILNRDSETQITKTGHGSPGNETDYFGALTKAAVIKFQNKHAAEILIPNGLTSGTGFVGLSTRVVLNTLATGKNVSASPQVNLPKKTFYCTPDFVVQHGPELTASEVAAMGCSSSYSQTSCEKVDTYTKNTGILSKDSIADCRWVSK